MSVAPTAARYLIAKYIPDVQRMEPRNIGIIVWSPDGVEARFAAEHQDRPGDVDARNLPLFVNSQGTYKQWVSFWRSQLDKPVMEPVRGGEPIERTSIDFLEALIATSTANYMLCEGGHILDYVSPDTMGHLADQLFRRLVDPTEPEEVRDPDLDELCDQLIDEAKLRSNPYFIRYGYRVQCPIRDGARSKVVTYEFSHAFKNGELQRLYQRVPLSKQRTTLRKTAHDSAWMFEKVIQQNIITREQGAMLVNVSEEQLENKEIADILDELCTVTRVLNVKDRKKILAEFEELALIQPH